MGQGANGRKLEVWTASLRAPPDAPRVAIAGEFAARAEDLGFDGASYPEGLNGDIFVMLTEAARATRRIRIGSGVVNPQTRHPGVLASGFASVNFISGGRAVMGIGRGDSSVKVLGVKPASLPQFEQSLRWLQAYMAGEEVDVDGLATKVPWIAKLKPPKPPMDVYATGPKVIAMAAAVADRITFALGADPERLAWAVKTAREAMAKAGRDPGEVSLGAVVNMAVSDDASEARSLIRGGLSVMMHFSAEAPQAGAAMGATEAKVVRAIGQKYEVAAHGQAEGANAAKLDDAFIDRMGVAGPASYCVERLQALVEAGVDRLVIYMGSIDSPAAPCLASEDRTAEHVLPALRQLVDR